MTKNVNNSTNQHVIRCGTGTVYLWFAPDYDARLANGEPKRGIERSVIRQRLQELGYGGALDYRPSGQPFLVQHPEVHLSISHAGPAMALYIADHPVGVDVEMPRERIREGRSYFVNEQEERADFTLDDLHLIWGAKEAVYKLLEGKIEDLKNDVCVQRMQGDNHRLQVTLPEQKLVLHYYIFNRLYLVYTS